MWLLGEVVEVTDSNQVMMCKSTSVTELCVISSEVGDETRRASNEVIISGQLLDAPVQQAEPLSRVCNTTILYCVTETDEVVIWEYVEGGYHSIPVRCVTT